MIITNIGSTIILTQYRILQRTSNITSVTTSTNMSKNHMFFDVYVFVTMLSRTQWFNLFSEKTRVSILWWWSTAELTLGIAPSSCNLMYHVLFGNCCLTKKMLKPNLIYLKYNLTLFRTKYRKTNNDNIYISIYVYSSKIFQVCFAFAQITHLICVSSRSGLQICHGYLLWYCNTYQIIYLNNSYFFLHLM